MIASRTLGPLRVRQLATTTRSVRNNFLCAGSMSLISGVTSGVTRLLTGGAEEIAVNAERAAFREGEATIIASTEGAGGRAGGRAATAESSAASHTAPRSQAVAEHSELAGKVEPVKPITNNLNAPSGWAKTGGTAITAGTGLYAYHRLHEDVGTLAHGAKEAAEAGAAAASRVAHQAADAANQHLHPEDFSPAEFPHPTLPLGGLTSGLASATGTVTTVIVVGLTAFIGLELYRRYGQS